MIRPLEVSYEAVYYDGQSTTRHNARVQLRAAELEISIENGAAFIWPYTSMRITADGTYGEPVRIEHEGVEALVIEAREFVEALRQHGVTHKTIPLDLRSWPAVLLCCIAIAVIATVLYSRGVRLAAEQAARFMPAGMERRLGLSVIAILAPEQARCTDSESRLQPIVNRLSAATGSRQPFKVIYVNQAIVNAFAAPGGFIVVFRGLLDETKTAEEFAGVLAHEMQHVLLKHSDQALAREFSARAMLSLMSVDSGGTPAAIEAGVRLANLKYQRSDEEAADLGGARLLARAHLPADGLAILLRRLQAYSMPGSSALSYLSNHPATEERLEALTQQARRLNQSVTPLMSAEDWAIARDVCAGK
jgi:predicted Zn-dependent protease